MKKRSFDTVLIIDAVLLLASVAANICQLSAGAGGTMAYISAFARILTALMGVYYVFSGCKKGDGSAYFKNFMGAFAAAQLLTIFAGLKAAGIVFTALSAAAYGILAFSKNLGKKKSHILAGSAAACMFLAFLSILFDKDFGAMWITAGTQLLLAFAALVMVIAKYRDKRARIAK